MKGNLMVRLMTLIILVAIVLAHFSEQTNLASLNWLWLAVVPALMGLQATFTGWCPAEMIGKLSKTGECCPGNSCGTKAQPAQSKSGQTQACCSGKTNANAESSKANNCCVAEDSKSELNNIGCCNKESSVKSTCCDGIIQIKVLGTGCATCENTAKLIESTATELGVAINLMKVEDVAEIASYGVMSTPGIIIDEQLKHSGGMPNKKQIIEWLM